MKIRKLLLMLSVLVLFATGCGAIDEQQAEKILSGAAQTTIAGVTFVPETPNATQDVNAIVQQTFAAMTAQAGGGQPLTTPPAPTPTTGSISGQLNYPAESLPAMYVTAYQIGTQNYQYVITNPGQDTYKIDNLPPGVYHVIAYTVGGGGFPAGLAGGYTQAVPCGLSAACTDHSLIDVTVTAGHDSSGANPYDWYAPAGTFPPFPQQSLEPTLSTTPMSSFPEMGSITGHLSYPASAIPALRIAAFEISTSEVNYMDTAPGQSSYSFDLPVGTYHVVAYTIGGGGYPDAFPGGYTRAVPCGLSVSCTDHSLINVTVTAGATTANVDPGDWYAPSGTFPPRPGP